MSQRSGDEFREALRKLPPFDLVAATEAMIEAGTVERVDPWSMEAFTADGYGRLTYGELDDD